MFRRPKKKDIRLHYINNTVLTSQKTRSVTIRKANRLMLYREIIGNECDLHVEHTNLAQCEQNVYLLMLGQGLR